ncbi:MAG: M6 family metalloprotease domain-containing protein [candidate division Zixibacteria bacterium]|nr:M6 family metalloprotease domain-containing protein [candidate division Zixibacteria bacterium]
MKTLIAGLGLGILALGTSGGLFDADTMPPHPDLALRSLQMAEAVDYYNDLRASFPQRAIDQPGGGRAAGANLAGTFNMLAVCIDFSDDTSSTAATDFDTLIFAQQPGSVWDYYHQISYGTLSMETVVLPSAIGWKRAPGTYASYVGGNYGMGSYPNNSQKMVEDIVDSLDPYVNFADYDNDSDGFVDGLVIVHAGTGAEWSGSTSDMWSHKWGIMPRLRDGVYISSYSVQPEFWFAPGDITIGVYVHEIGHVLGLPDLYDTDNSSRGVARWSVMGSGSWNGTMGNTPAGPDAWCRVQLGFVVPTVITSSVVGATVPRVEDSAKIYRVWPTAPPGSEYFLVENRQLTGYDTYLPGAGILIWHIDEAQANETHEWYPGHTASGHYLVALEQADGLWEMEQNINNGNAGDPFPGTTDKRTFSDASTPSSKSYAGTATYVTVTNISNSAAVMTCDFQTSLGTDVLEGKDGGAAVPSLYLVNSPNPFNPATVINYGLERGGRVDINLFDILGRHVRTLVGETQPAGPHGITWDGTDQSGEPVSSGVYFARLSSSGQSNVRKMVLVR